MAINVPHSNEPITDKPVRPSWYQFFTHLLRLVNGKLSADAVSAFMLTLLDDANAAAALTTLGVSSEWQSVIAEADAYGSYTPTLTNVANLDSTTALTLRYFRIGPLVVVFGPLGTDTTAAASTPTEVGISLPIASNFTSSINLTGIGASEGNTMPARILADPTNDRARYFYRSSTTAAITHGMWFAYVVQ